MPHLDHPSRIDLEQALQIVGARAAQHRLPVEAIATADALGRVLAEDVTAAHALPPFANAAMDGFALRAADLPAHGEAALALAGEIMAGATSASGVSAGQCVRITTGAPMPPGTDTVVVKENAVVAGDRVLVKAGETPGANVRAAGEDYAEGDLAVPAGTPLAAAQLALLAACGVTGVKVRRQPRIAVIATGDELVPAGQPLGFGGIHDSNGPMLAALARASGARVVLQCCVRDQRETLRSVLLDAAAEADLIVSSGGVSAGEADHLPGIAREIGEIHFHKVRLKPGMPTLFAGIGACLYFGLPGNPVASAVTFRVFVRFAMRAMLGMADLPAPSRARLDAPLHKRHPRAEFARCKLHGDAEGVQWATLHASQGSAMLRGLVESDVLALLPEGEREYQRGDVVTLWPG
jgi:molybdopterin molybdotransferase